MSSSFFSLASRRRLTTLTLAAFAIGLADTGRLWAADPASPQKVSQQLYADSKIKTTPRFSVEVTGHGPDLILIPGLACSREVWRSTADRLRGKYTLHILQIAGFAGEPARDNANGPVLDPTVKEIDNYITSNKLAPAVVIGHSMGGTMAMRLAQLHPADVKKTLLVDSLPFYGVLIGGNEAKPDSIKPIALAVQKQMSAPSTDASKAQSKAMIEQMVIAPANVDLVTGWGSDSDHKVVGQAIYDDMMLDMRPGLARMKTPVTLIYPFDEKRGVPLEKLDALYQAQFEPIPQKKLVRVDDARHFVMMDQPGKFDAAVDDFLKE